MNIRTFILIVTVAAVMSACKTTKYSESAPKKPVAGAEIAPKVTNVTAKLDVNVKTLKDDITVDGRLYMRYNEMIRITVVPFGLMEAARLEFTPQEVLLIDKINKQYVRAKYEEVNFMQRNDITFQAIQSRFWDEYQKKNITLDVGAAVLNIKVSKIDHDDSWNASMTSVSSKYKAVSVAELMDQFTRF